MCKQKDQRSVLDHHGALGLVHNSMITVMEFSAKQAAGSRYIMLTHENYFFIGIDLDWLEHKKDGEFLVFNVINQSIWFFSLKNIKLGEELLFVTLFDYFHF